MAVAGQALENPITGERIVFRKTAADTGGEFLEFDDFWSRPDHRVSRHVHPEMDEQWLLIAGSVRFLIGDDEFVATAGDKVVAPAGTPHMSWNAGDGPAHLRITMNPAHRWEDFVERLFAAACNGRTDAHGVPDRELLGELLREYRKEFAAVRR